MKKGIIILDFGSQVTKLIAKSIRKNSVFSEILPFNADIEKIKEKQPAGIILSGSPFSVYEKDAPICSKEIFSLGIPVLGICYGMQIISHFFDGKVEGSDDKEYGRTKIGLDNSSKLFSSLGKEETVWMSHGDKLESLPDGFHVIASSSSTPYAAIVNINKQVYAVQFHPEVTHTDNGDKILSNFVDICKCSRNWTPESFVKTQIELIRKKVGNEKVILGLSGGVDSSVTAILLHKAIGDKLIPVFVDTGLLRENETDIIKEVFIKQHNIDVKIVDAGEDFLRALKNVSDPETKRKRIGHKFIEIFEQEARLHNVKFLAQGTLYPDVIESVSFVGPSVTIKSHHNVGGLPEKMGLELIEPFRECFKDEVRNVGKELGLVNEILGRHPFPGPGLAIRILGEVTQEKVSMLQKADAIFISELKDAGLYDEIWQAGAILTNIKSVGVMGDGRSYESAIALRAVTSVDGMTADWAKIPFKTLGKISNRIINEVSNVNRVVFDISSKPPATIEWE